MEKKTDLRIVKTYKSLCDAFMELLTHKKFDKITVNELCEQAMVRRATFYKHFADKYEFFGFFVRYIHEGFIHNTKQSPSEEATSFYILNLKQCIDFFKQHNAIVQNVVNSSSFLLLLEIMTDEISKQIIANTQLIHTLDPNNTLNSAFQASFLAGGIVESLRLWVTKPNMISEEDLLLQLSQILAAIEEH